MLGWLFLWDNNENTAMPVDSCPRITTTSLLVSLLGLSFTTTTTSLKAQPNAAVLEEVVVTAQRREENLQDVPIAVVALSSDIMENFGAVSTADIPQLVSSVQLLRSGPSSMFFVRGVGNISGNTGEESANAMYLDGVYLYNKAQAAMKFNSVERVEVLKGPQGTLFGRNSSGGLINVVTREPGAEIEGKFSVGYANYDTYTGQGYIGGPLTDTLSADIAFTGTDQRDGWGDNPVTGSNVSLGWDWGLRTKWVWLPTDVIKLVFSADYGEQEDDLATAFRLSQDSVGVTGSLPPKDPYDTISGNSDDNKQRDRGLALTLDWDLGPVTLTSITGWRDNKTNTDLDIDTEPAPLGIITINNTTEALQEEVRLASNSSGPLNWQAGLFYMDAEVSLKPQSSRGLAFGGPNAGSDIYSTMDTLSYAGFGELTWDISDTTHITAGLRYTTDELDINGRIVPVGTSASVLTNRDSQSYEGETFRLALQHDFSESLMVYASYNRGFKSGTFSTPSIFDPPVAPQDTDAYEIGLKSELLDHRLRLNLSGFYYVISDYQTRASANQSVNSRLLNAAEVEVEGFEFDFEAALSEALRLVGSATFLNSKFSRFPNASYAYPLPAVCTPDGPSPGEILGAPSGGKLECVGDAAGNKTPWSPDITATLGAIYTTQLGSAGELKLSAHYNYNDGYFFEPDNFNEQSSFGLLNVLVGYYPTEQLGFELWGRNLTDELFYLQSSSAFSFFEAPGAPRTYGVRVNYSF